jgi:hypothetical protein
LDRCSQSFTSRDKRSEHLASLPEDPVFGTWYCLSFKIFFLKVVPGTKCSTKIFQKMFRSKHKVFGPLGRCTGTGTKSPKNRRKKFKKNFFRVFVPVQIPYFWTYQIFEKFCCSIWYLVLPSKKQF